MRRNLYLVLLGFILQTPLFGQVGIGTENPDPSAQLDIRSSDKGILIPRMGSQQRMNINNPAKGLMVFDTVFSQFFYYNGTAWIQAMAQGPEGPQGPMGGTGPFHLGKDTLGGIVFHIYTGSDQQQHGLIVSISETTAAWQNPTSMTNANRTWDGQYNTNLMTNSPAKNWVANLGGSWYLPSIDELSLLWHNRFNVNKALFTGGYPQLMPSSIYWSSTETGLLYAWTFNFASGDSIYSGEKVYVYRVRAVKAF